MEIVLYFYAFYLTTLTIALTLWNRLVGWEKNNYETGETQQPSNWRNYKDICLEKIMSAAINFNATGLRTGIWTRNLPNTKRSPTFCVWCQVDLNSMMLISNFVKICQSIKKLSLTVWWSQKRFVVSNWSQEYLIAVKQITFVQSNATKVCLINLKYLHVCAALFGLCLGHLQAGQHKNLYRKK